MLWRTVEIRGSGKRESGARCTRDCRGRIGRAESPIFQNNIARDNTIDLTNSDFVVKAPLYAQIIEGNHVNGCTAGWYTEPAGIAHAVIFRNNLVENCHFAFQGAAHVGSDMQGIVIENNEFIDCGGAQLISDVIRPTITAK